LNTGEGSKGCKGTRGGFAKGFKKETKKDEVRSTKFGVYKNTALLIRGEKQKKDLCKKVKKKKDG